MGRSTRGVFSDAQRVGLGMKKLPDAIPGSSMKGGFFGIKKNSKNPQELMVCQSPHKDEHMVVVLSNIFVGMFTPKVLGKMNKHFDEYGGTFFFRSQTSFINF